ncbi:MAG: PTS lactose/cellobiose transporter subunit IIA [Erysipelotrichia bacterium]|nr:PTS lactose/cellobiose transporter subunit IIA [Erysipelotrichia bacterium]
MENTDLNRLIMQIIAYSGESIGYSMEALNEVGNKDFSKAEENIVLAEQSLRKAHIAHTEILTYEANNLDKNIVNCLLVHASTHLANAELSKEMAKKIKKIMGGEQND